MPRQDGIGQSANPVRAVGASPVVSSALANVFVRLSKQIVILVFCDMWNTYSVGDNLKNLRSNPTLRCVCSNCVMFFDECKSSKRFVLRIVTDITCRNHASNLTACYMSGQVAFLTLQALH